MKYTKPIFIIVLIFIAATLGFYFLPEKTPDPNHPGSPLYERKMEELRRQSTLRNPSLIVRPPAKIEASPRAKKN